MTKIWGLITIVLVGFSTCVFFVSSCKKNKAEGNAVKTEQVNVTSVFKTYCAVAGCHRGQFPKKKLNLEPDKYYDALVNVSSRQIDSLKLVDTANPEKSYLLMKLKKGENIVGDPMPIDSPPMKKEEIKIVEDWVYNLKLKGETEAKKEDISTNE